MKMIALLFFFSLPAANALLGVIGTPQTVAVKGQLLCNGAPVQGVKVKLYDVNTFIKDNFLDEQYTDEKGFFAIKGTETDITTMDPKFNIYHKCNYHGLCEQKVEIVIPNNYISSGNTAMKVFDLGEMELGGKFKGQNTDCVN